MSTQAHPGLVEHATLDHQFRHLFGAFERKEEGAASRLLSDVSAAIRSHFAHESRALDELAASDPAEAAALREEHRSLLSALERLEHAALARTLVAADVFAFKARFSLHEAREELGLYRRLRGGRWRAQP